MALDPFDEVTPKDLGAVLDHTLDRIARRARGDERPVPLPWACLANALGGGLWGGTSVGLLGDSGSGKTQFALQAALYAAESGVPICYVALQSPEDQVAARLLALRAGRNWAALYTGRDGNDIEDLRRTHAQAVRALPIHVVGGSAGRWSYHNVRAVSAWMRARYPEETPGGRPFMVVIDIVQPVSSPERDMDQRAIIERTAHEARLVARELGAVVVLILHRARGRSAPAGRRGGRPHRVQARPAAQPDPGPRQPRQARPRQGPRRPRAAMRYSARAHPRIFARGQALDARLVRGRQEPCGSRAWCALRFDGCRFESDEDTPRSEPPDTAAEETEEVVGK